MTKPGLDISDGIEIDFDVVAKKRDVDRLEDVALEILRRLTAPIYGDVRPYLGPASEESMKVKHENEPS